jgi:two-component system chemotaxis sensor kinase CheA
MTQPRDPMAEIRASFFVESDELLESLQDGLLAMEDGAHDSETINTVFRAVHSIKGGAGAFALSALVAFAHRFETVLDALRSGKIVVSADLLKQFFQAADLLQDQVRAAQAGTPEPDQSEAVLLALEAFLGGGQVVAATEEVSDFMPLTLSFDFGGDPGPDMADADRDADQDPDPATGAATPPGWAIRFRPHAALYASGNEPLLILRALAALGPVAVRCDMADLPPLDTLDVEGGSLAWLIDLQADLPEADVRDVFDFVADIADISIMPREAAADEAQGHAEPDQDDAGPEGPVAKDPVAAGPAAGGAGAADADARDPGSDPDDAVAAAAVTVAGAGDRREAGGADSALAPLARPEVGSPGAAGQTVDTPTAARAAGGAPGGAAGGGAGGGAVAAGAEPGATVRVDLDRIDRLVNLVGELVINQAMLAQSVTAAGLAQDSAVMAGLDSFMMLTRDIQDSVMMIRAQPVKPLFQRMARIVREAAQAVGKDVRLRTEGETTEVDKTVIERLADPLTHMIRNAVDHGLEHPEDRRAAGKSVEGQITLSAAHRSGRVIIEIVDDGAGINRARVLETAVRKGLVAPEAQLSEAEIDALLFLPGFSTASTVSNLSGRGVGMDVVKRAIQGLGGRITIQSERGRGTSFSISLPLTLAVLDGMVVEVAGETLVVPLSSIIETAMLNAGDIRALGPETSVIHIRGGFVPLYDLGVELGFRAPRAPDAGGIVLLALIEDGSRVGLIVDAIVEQRQVVIKGLQQSYGPIPGIAAATILGDGQIALILDPADLVRSASGRCHDRTAGAAARTGQDGRAAAEAAPALAPPSAHPFPSATAAEGVMPPALPLAG